MYDSVYAIHADYTHGEMLYARLGHIATEGLDAEGITRSHMKHFLFMAEFDRYDSRVVGENHVHRHTNTN